MPTNRPQSLLALAATSIVLVVAAVACNELPLIDSTRYVEYYSDRDVELCAGTGERVDRYIESMFDRFGEEYPDGPFIRYEINAKNPTLDCDYCYYDEDGFIIVSRKEPDNVSLLVHGVLERISPGVNDVVVSGFALYYGSEFDYASAPSTEGYFESLVMDRSRDDFDSLAAWGLFASVVEREGTEGVEKLFRAGRETKADKFAAALSEEFGMSTDEIEASFDEKELCFEKVAHCLGPMMEQRDGGWSWTGQGGCTTSPAAVGMREPTGRFVERVTFTLDEFSSVRVRTDLEMILVPCTAPCEFTWGRSFMLRQGEPDVWWDLPPGAYEVGVLVEEEGASSNVEVDVVPQ